MDFSGTGLLPDPDAHCGDWRIREVTAGREHLHSIADVFDDRSDEIWIDMFHLGPTGNRRIAAAMLEHRQDPRPRPASATQP